MRWDLFARFVLDYAVIFPGALLCYLPVRQYITLPGKGLIALVVSGLSVAVALSAAYCTHFLCASNHLLIPLMMGTFTVYRLTVSREVSLGKLLYVFATMASFLAACTMLSSLLTAAWELNNPDPVVLASTSLVCLGLSSFIMGICYPIISPWFHWMIDEFHIARVWRVAWVLPLCFTGMYILMQPWEAATVLVNRVQSMGVVLVLAALLVQMFLMYLLYRIAREIETNARLTAENQLLSMEAHRYQELRTHMEETRMLRHDFRQHVRVITNLNAAGQAAELTDYLRQLDTNLDSAHPTLCANPAVDAVAGYYHQYAIKNQVPIDWQLSLPRELPLPETDICMLLGNLLENAVTASLKLPLEKRRIRVICQMLSPAMLGLIVENPYDGMLKKEKGQLLSTRHEGLGLGLQSVQITVNRYHGQLTIETENFLFGVNVLLNL